MTYWFTSDQHWFHNNIIRLCNRPFNSLEHMQNQLIENTNKDVRTDDVLYVLGPDSFEKSLEQDLEIWYRIHCENIYLIPGNHHTALHKNIDAYRFCGRFLAVEYEFHHKINGQAISMGHYPLQSWDKSHRGAWNLHGHHHGSIGHDIPYRRIDVGVDSWNYHPVSFDEIKRLFNTEESKMGFHHER